MNKFKKGDKVFSVVNDNHMLTMYKAYTVKRVDDNYVWVVNNRGDLDYFFPEKFELMVDGTEDIENMSEEGVKYDSDKLEYSLLPKGVLNKVVNILGFGSKKYAKDNWMKVDNPKERYYNAAQRHINQWWEGEKYDSETGENHLAHAICCLMFMLWFDNQEDKEVNK